MINLLLARAAWILTAASDSDLSSLVQRFSRGFGDSRMPDLGSLWYWTILIVGPCVITIIVFRWKMIDDMHHGPAYRRLATRLGLGRVDRLLVNRLARRAGKQNGSSLLLSRGMFDYCLSLHPPAIMWIHKRLRAVRARLFH